MKIIELAVLAIEACEAEGVEHMLTGAFATGHYGIPRSTTDVDLVLKMSSLTGVAGVIARLEAKVDFSDQVQFDTLTWGKRHVGQTREAPFLKVEFFELFEDLFVQKQFSRRVKARIGALKIETFIPTAEDVIVQKLRWGRDKDLIDARDVLAVQQPENLDMDYTRQWCVTHGHEERLNQALARLPEV